jgi:hypothetical protein
LLCGWYLLASLILSTLPKPNYFCYSTYCTSKVGLAKFAFKFNAANCALDTGLLASLVLSTFVININLSNTTTPTYH